VTEPGDGLEGNAGHLDRSSRVQAVVSFAGPTDLTAEDLQTEQVRTRNLEPLFGGALAAKQEDYRKASPALYHPRTPAPTLLVHGSVDSVVPVQQALALQARLRQAGGEARVIVLEGEGHTWAGPQLTRSIDQMLTFLDAALKR
jgi:dipeptidyl aminopeptidase/acylaminoacyl peptidase